LLVRSAELGPKDVVLEVGPGTGGLTDLLVAHARDVVCVEIDRELQEILTDRFAPQPHWSLVRGDILQNKHSVRPEIGEWLHAAAERGDTVKLVSNLPYQVATPLIMNLLVDYPQVRRLCFTVQAEVGGRILAEPGSRDYGPISIIPRLLARTKVVARLSPEVFWPAPTVESLMLQMEVDEDSPLSREVVGAFAGFVRAVFEHRRKALRSALSYVVSDADRELAGRVFDTSRRPETFAPIEWLDLFELLGGSQRADQKEGRRSGLSRTSSSRSRMKSER